MRLIPEEGRNTASYWCSWRNQRLFMPNPFLHMNVYDPAAHGILQREMLSDEFLFGRPGVVAHYMQGVRRDMYVMLDDGWDIPYLGNHKDWGSLVLNPDRFPYGGKTPAENLAILNRKILDLGYAGTALWVPMQCAGESGSDLFDLARFRAFWVERARWLDEAGIAYIKADWGLHSRSPIYRELLTDILREYAPRVQIEHAVIEGWYHAPDTDLTPFANIFRVADAFRCYDVRFDFNSSSTLGRAAHLLTLDVGMKEGCRGLLNVGEEPYIAAALGCTMGIMSHPMLRGSIISMLPDDFKNGISHRATLKSEFHSFDHYERALRWQRVAPAFPYRRGETVSSGEWLEDSWTYEKEPYPYLPQDAKGTSVRQSAPAAVARNTPLPEIVGSAPYHENRHRPFVIASRNRESGAFTVATLPRTVDGVMNCTTPEAHVLCREVPADAPFAVFGCYASLTLEFDRPIEGMRLFGGDLLRDEVGDITDCEGVTLEGNRLVLDGALLERLGTECASFHDLADPGSVFRLTRA